MSVALHLVPGTSLLHHLHLVVRQKIRRMVHPCSSHVAVYTFYSDELRGLGFSCSSPYRALFHLGCSVELLLYIFSTTLFPIETRNNNFFFKAVENILNNAKLLVLLLSKLNHNKYLKGTEKLFKEQAAFSIALKKN